MNHIVCVDTGCLCELRDIYKSLDLIAKAGYKFYDFSVFYGESCDFIDTKDDYQDRARKLKEYADKLGLTCYQSHAYFTTGTDEKAIQVRKEKITRDIIITSILGAHLSVVHPIWELSLEENVKFLKSFEETAKKYDVKLAVENIWGVTNNEPSPMCSSNPENMLKLLELLNSDTYVVCLDFGHAEMSNLKTSAIDFIQKLGKRIKTIHIHDNDKYSDLHQIPYTHKIDFGAIFKELKAIGYDGPVNFEVERCYSHLPFELYEPTLIYTNKIGEYFKKVLDE